PAARRPLRAELRGLSRRRARPRPATFPHRRAAQPVRQPRVPRGARRAALFRLLATPRPPPTLRQARHRSKAAALAEPVLHERTPLVSLSLFWELPRCRSAAGASAEQAA